MKVPMNAFSKTIEALLRSGARRATLFLDANLTVKATRRHRPRNGATITEILVTFGRPNYAERAFVRACRKAKESFPVRKIQLRDWPKKK